MLKDRGAWQAAVHGVATWLGNWRTATNEVAWWDGACFLTCRTVGVAPFLRPFLSGGQGWGMGCFLFFFWENLNMPTVSPWTWFISFLSVCSIFLGRRERQEWGAKVSFIFKSLNFPLPLPRGQACLSSDWNAQIFINNVDDIDQK